MGNDLRRSLAIRAASLLLILLTVAACTQSAESVKAARERDTAAAQMQSGAAGGTSSLSATDADMVAAVSNVGSTTPVSLKFRLTSRPEVGNPLKIEIALVPDPAVNILRMHLAFQPGEGLELEGEQRLDIEEGNTATTARHDLIVLPKQAGVLQLRATVVVDADSASVARNYVIPIIATEPLSPAPP